MSENWEIIMAAVVVFASVMTAMAIWGERSLKRDLIWLSEDFEEHKKYYGGQIWESPAFLRCSICLAGNGKMMLVSDPTKQGMCALTEKNGKWLYTMPELKERLKGWKYVGENALIISKCYKKNETGK